MVRRDGELALTDDRAAVLCATSPATIDRRLAGDRLLAGFRSRSHTEPGTLLDSQIPIRTRAGWDDTGPGSIEIDLVGHEGGNSSGESCFTLTATDIATGRTIDRSVENRAAIRVFEALPHVIGKFPFPILGIDSDNGSEFIDHHLFAHCDQRRITYTRPRPGNKNDGAHVEQKTRTHVRELVGHPRFDTEAELEVRNAIWTLDQGSTNHLLAQQRLHCKQRHGVKVTKRNDTAQIPFARVLADRRVTDTTRRSLRAKHNRIRPGALFRVIRAHSTQLERLALAEAPAPVKPPSTGPSTTTTIRSSYVRQ